MELVFYGLVGAGAAVVAMVFVLLGVWDRPAGSTSVVIHYVDRRVDNRRQVFMIGAGVETQDVAPVRLRPKEIGNGSTKIVRRVGGPPGAAQAAAHGPAGVAAPDR